MRAKRRRAGRPGLILAVVALAAAAPSGAAERTADPARIVTWDSPAVSQSRFVDPSAAPDGYYAEPPGVDPRPNALKLDVYLPAGYSTHPARRYPVLWLLHGHGDAYDSWPNAGNGDLLNTASGFPGIIVMPEGDHGWYANWWNGGVRGDPAWERYHLDQLLPYVNHRLRIRHGRRWHAIAGLSMGGEGAAYYATQRPGYFGSAASFSGVLSMERPEWPTAFNTQGEDFDTVFGGAGSFYVAGHDPTTLIDNLRSTRLFVSAGDGVPDPTIPSEVTNYFGAGRRGRASPARDRLRRRRAGRGRGRHLHAPPGDPRLALLEGGPPERDRLGPLRAPPRANPTDVHPPRRRPREEGG